MPSPRRPLPEALNIGYANWGECDGKIEQAAADGVNVIIWFALNLVVASDGNPRVTGGPNLTCVGQLSRRLDVQRLPTHHFISIGGWDAPHPSPNVDAARWWRALAAYDEQAARAGLRGGFDGIDIDLEGSDNRSSPSNTFDPATLRVVAAIATRAKAAGKMMSLAPPQSYLDCTTSRFTFSVIEPARCWTSGSGTAFRYAGRNAYAAFLALTPPDTFDFISLQLCKPCAVRSAAQRHTANAIIPPPQSLPPGHPPRRMRGAVGCAQCTVVCVR